MSRPPPRSPWFLALARRYARRRLARGLDGFFADGLEAARAAVRARPVVLAANHVGWWDSFLVVALDEALGTEGYALMDAGSVRHPESDTSGRGDTGHSPARANGLQVDRLTACLQGILQVDSFLK